MGIFLYFRSLSASCIVLCLLYDFNALANAIPQFFVDSTSRIVMDHIEILAGPGRNRCLGLSVSPVFLVSFIINFSRLFSYLFVVTVGFEF